jgi:hypothetical protein
MKPNIMIVYQQGALKLAATAVYDKSACRVRFNALKYTKLKVGLQSIHCFYRNITTATCFDIIRGPTGMSSVTIIVPAGSGWGIA